MFVKYRSTNIETHVDYVSHSILIKCITSAPTPKGIYKKVCNAHPMKLCRISWLMNNTK